MKRCLLFSCEHGGNQIPEAYQPLFENAGELLQTHRGYDLGALDLAKAFEARYDTSLSYVETSRLIVDCNRSIGSNSLFSSWTSSLSAEEKQEILQKYYIPYRQSFQQKIVDAVDHNTSVLHLSVHSFTPVLKGHARKTDVGILFDPRRDSERSVGTLWKSELQRLLPGWTIHQNLPYRGTSDGFTTGLRKEFPGQKYSGLELEINQRHVGSEKWQLFQEQLVKSIQIFL